VWLFITVRVHGLHQQVLHLLSILLSQAVVEEDLMLAVVVVLVDLEQELDFQ